MGLTSPKCAGWASRLEARESLMLHLTFEGCLLQNSLWLGGSQPFVLFRPSVDWSRPTHIWRRWALLKAHWRQCSSHPKNTLRETSRKRFDHIAGHHGPANGRIKLTIPLGSHKQSSKDEERGSKAREAWGSVKWYVVILADTSQEASKITAGYSASVSGWHMVPLQTGCREKWHFGVGRGGRRKGNLSAISLPSPVFH